MSEEDANERAWGPRRGVAEDQRWLVERLNVERRRRLLWRMALGEVPMMWYRGVLLEWDAPNTKALMWTDT